MKGAQIHQLLHGYRRGHQLLAGSMSLPGGLSELVTRLSDLSGLLMGDAEFEPYLTSYPLPDSDFYALAKTWPDHLASRSGCVLTHTLLIPQKTWASANNPATFGHLFRAPDGNIDRYKLAVTIDDHLSESDSPLKRPHLNAALQLVANYFGEGLRPVVWFDQPFPEDVFWLLVQALWPKLRRNFACCTYSLQPRELDERPFDILFAPSKAYSRFNKIPSSNVIEANSTRRISSDDKEEAWVLDLAQVIFRYGEVSQLAEEFDEFKSLLNEEPTSVRNFFLIRNLQDRAKSSATAGVGLMDVVASLAPAEKELPEFKKNIVSRALHAAHDTPNADESLKCYFLISERLEQEAYKSVRQEMFQDLKSEVCSLTRRKPEAAIGVGERLFARSNLALSSAYALGLVSGLQQLAEHSPNKLKILHQFPITAGVLIVNEPEIARGYLRGVKDGEEEFIATADISSWIASVTVPEIRAKLRATLLPEIRDDADAPLAEQMLRDVRSDEISEILNILSEASEGFRSADLRNVIIEILARRYPDEVRDWSDESKIWSEGIASIIAATFEASIEGLKDLLKHPFGATIRKTQVLTAFLEYISVRNLPLWFKDYAKHHADFLVPLMALGQETPRETLNVLQRVIIEVKDIPIAEEHDLLEKIGSFTSTQFGYQLADIALRSSVAGFIAGQLELEEYERWQTAPYASEWFASVSSWELQSLVNSSCHDGDSWVRAWSWLAHSPDVLFWRSPALTPKLVESLISVKRYHWDWPISATTYWVEILRRSLERKHNSMFLELCANALEFAFNHVDYPLSGVVIESFWHVYITVLAAEETSSSGFLFDLLRWLDWDWDKAKDLRKKLVASFLHSSWPPGDLALTVKDEVLLRKIFKRLIKNRNGVRYVEAMITDLLRRNTQEAKSLANQLTDLLRNPDFYEPWD